MIKKYQGKFFLVVLIVLLVTGCGGGSSNSGGKNAIQNSEVPLYMTGVYSGTMTLKISNVDFASDSTDTPISFDVTGEQAEAQQVSSVFTQFSGSSSISSSGQFSIPSGQFSLRIVDPSRVSTIAVCKGELVFEGTFIETMADGTIGGQFNCPFSSTPLIADGAFSTSLGQSKQKAIPADLDLKFYLK